MTRARVAGAQTPVAMRVGTTGNDTYSEVYYAAEQGYFGRAGLNVDISTFNNGAAGSAAVASGAIDVGVSSPLQVAQAFARGIPFVLVAAGALNTEKEPSALLCVARRWPWPASICSRPGFRPAPTPKRIPTP